MTTRRLFLAGLTAACATEPPMSDQTVFELRNYLTQPGGRDVLIDLFERHFIPMQEDEGACVVGTFRNLDDPDRFVWMRSFQDFAARAPALNAIYTSPTWLTHRTAANATIIDSDNVLLLRPHTGSLACAGERPPVGATAIPSSVIAVSTYYLRPGGEDEFAPFFEADIAPRLRNAGGAVRATFITEQRENNYARLPVREDVNVFVSVTRFTSIEAQSDSARALGALGREIESRIVQPSETFRLQPTPRSLLR
jgi:hypothetical protein